MTLCTGFRNVPTSRELREAAHAIGHVVEGRRRAQRLDRALAEPRVLRPDHLDARRRAGRIEREGKLDALVAGQVRRQRPAVVHALLHARHVGLHLGPAHAVRRPRRRPGPCRRRPCRAGSSCRPPSGRRRARRSPRRGRRGRTRCPPSRRSRCRARSRSAMPVVSPLRDLPRAGLDADRRDVLDRTAHRGRARPRRRPAASTTWRDALVGARPARPRSVRRARSRWAPAPPRATRRRSSARSRPARPSARRPGSRSAARRPARRGRRRRTRARRRRAAAAPASPSATSSCTRWSSISSSIDLGRIQPGGEKQGERGCRRAEPTETPLVMKRRRRLVLVSRSRPGNCPAAAAAPAAA